MEDMKSINEQFEKMFRALYDADEIDDLTYEPVTDPHATKNAIKWFEKLFKELYGDDDAVSDRIHSLLDSNTSNTIEED